MDSLSDRGTTSEDDHGMTLLLEKRVEAAHPRVAAFQKTTHHRVLRRLGNVIAVHLLQKALGVNILRRRHLVEVQVDLQVKGRLSHPKQTCIHQSTLSAPHRRLPVQTLHMRRL